MRAIEANGLFSRFKAVSGFAAKLSGLASKAAQNAKQARYWRFET